MIKIPHDWTRFMGVDPGHTAQAALMIAIPPPEAGFGDLVLAYDEVFLKRKDANEFAATIAQKTSGQVFQAFVMDSRAGRQTPYGASQNVRGQYADAFNRYGLRSIETGSSFLPGCDDMTARAMIVREWLAMREDGTTKLRVVRDTTPVLQDQMTKFKKRVIRDETRDEPIAKDCDMVVCLEYLAAMRPAWTQPDYGKLPPSPAFAAAQYFRELSRKMNGRDHVDFGSPLAAA